MEIGFVFALAFVFVLAFIFVFLRFFEIGHSLSFVMEIDLVGGEMPAHHLIKWQIGKM